MDQPKAIADELQTLDDRRAQVLSLSDVAALAEQVAAVFPQFEFRVSITKWTCDPPFVCMMCDVIRFDDLIPVFRDLATRGWHTDKTEPFSDYHEIDRRTYNLLQPGEDMAVDTVSGASVRRQYFAHRLRLMVFPRKDGAVCRKVEVGKKEVPVYEFVCE